MEGKTEFMKTILLIAMVLGSSACATSYFKTVSAGQMGCSDPDEVVISNEKSGYGSHSWTATCEGHRFVCSIVATGGYGLVVTNSQVMCHEALTQARR